MRFHRFKPILISVLIASTLCYSGCFVTVKELVVTPIDVSSFDGIIESGVRAHTTEGYVLIFPFGVRVASDSLYGQGKLYGLNLEEEVTPIESYPKTQIVAMETMSLRVDKTNTAVASSIGTLVIAGLAALVLISIAVASAFSHQDGTPDVD